MIDDRVITVQHKSKNTLVKVCDSWDAYEHWLENYCQFDKEDMTAVSAKIYKQ